MVAGRPPLAVRDDAAIGKSGGSQADAGPGQPEGEGRQAKRRERGAQEEDDEAVEHEGKGRSKLAADNQGGDVLATRSRDYLNFEQEAKQHLDGKGIAVLTKTKAAAGRLKMWTAARSSRSVRRQASAPPAYLVAVLALLGVGPTATAATAVEAGVAASSSGRAGAPVRTEPSDGVTTAAAPGSEQSVLSPNDPRRLDDFELDAARLAAGRQQHQQPDPQEEVPAPRGSETAAAHINEVPINRGRHRRWRSTRCRRCGTDLGVIILCGPAEDFRCSDCSILEEVAAERRREQGGGQNS